MNSNFLFVFTLFHSSVEIDLPHVVLWEVVKTPCSLSKTAPLRAVCSPRPRRLFYGKSFSPNCAVGLTEFNSIPYSFENTRDVVKTRQKPTLCRHACAYLNRVRSPGFSGAFRFGRVKTVISRSSDYRLTILNLTRIIHKKTKIRH